MIVNKKKRKKKKLTRYSALWLVMVAIFTIIGLKAAYLQIFKNDYYKDKANANGNRFISEKTPRGKIIDSAGNVLATNRQTYVLTYTMPDDGNRSFYGTMDKLFKVLKDNDEKILDEMLIKLDKNGKAFYQFKNANSESQKYEKIRFLKDRGFASIVRTKLFGDQNTDLTDVQIEKIDSELEKIEADEAFYELIKIYSLVDIIDPKPYIDSEKPTKEERNAFSEKLASYNDRKEKYKEMSGKDILEKIVEKGYTIEKIREYMIIKDAIKMQSFKGYKSITIANNIKKETAFVIYQMLNELQGINVELQPVRYYPYKELGSAVLGYISPIDSSLKDSYSLMGYDVESDLVGKSGIESAFESDLKGTKGGRTVKVNSDGNETQELFNLESYPGNNVHLTIDKNIQYATQKALEDTINDIRLNKSSQGYGFPNATRGAAVAVEVETGRILALASYPDYDPNKFAIPGQLSKEEIEKYFSPDLEEFGKKIVKQPGVKKSLDQLFPKDKNGFREDKYDLYPKPFFNYATLGTIPPGSIFKPMTGLIGLEEGVVSPNETIMTSGVFNTHPGTFGSSFAPVCWIHTKYGGSHGAVDGKRALQVSCNVYFYEVAYRLYQKKLNEYAHLPKEERVGKALDSIAEWAWKFGLGHDPKAGGNNSTGIEIEENKLGQTYNFDSYKENIIGLARFNLNDALVKGDYNGTRFVPFDFAADAGDSQELEKAKIDLKSKINGRLKAVGTKEGVKGYNEFLEFVLPDVKKIMDISPKYQESFKNKGGVRTIESEASIVANVITQFTVNDKASEMVSPAQLVFASIGQGINNFTPIQLASYVSTLANGGKRNKLHLVDKVTTASGEVVKEYKTEVLSDLKLKKSTVDTIREGMRRANYEPGGTAAATFSSFPIVTAGKTGTADYSNEQREYGRAPFATYASFAPADKPEIAFVGVIYDGGGGSSTAKVAKATYEAYFRERLEKDHPGYVQNSESFKKYILDAPKDNKEGALKENKK